MKPIYSILILILLVVSCSGDNKTPLDTIINTNNLETIRKKRGELVNEQQALNDNIKLLDEKIKTLDSSKNIPLITTFTAKTEVFNHVIELQGNVTTKKPVNNYTRIQWHPY
jgi:hypothetical protein